MIIRTAITFGVGFLLALLFQRCCNNVACDPPPEGSITIIVSLDSLNSGLTSSEFSSIIITKKTYFSHQEIIDTLSNDHWYYSYYSDNPNYPRYDLRLGWEDGDQNYEYIVKNNKGLEFIINDVSLNFRKSNSRCCSGRILSFMTFNLNDKRYEISNYYYELIIEK